uniref:Uncharacterized protein n=1 Tax=Anguilla anguilla TaxID=7936 RepID=A0A0E9UN05_ANGAN
MLIDKEAYRTLGRQDVLRVY